MSDLNEVQSIDVQIAELQAKRKSILDEKRATALNEAKTLINTFGFTVSELGLSKAPSATNSDTPKKPRTPKYANPADPTQTYGGGAKPTWLKDILAAGGKLEDMRIKK